MASVLSWRLPPRLRRLRTVLPDQTGTGALPLWRAKASFERTEGHLELSRWAAAWPERR